MSSAQKDEQELLAAHRATIHNHRPWLTQKCDLFKRLPDAVIVSTTRPVLEGSLPLPILSDRLIIRSYCLSDLDAYHTLLSQPEAMEGNNMSPSLSYTKEILEDQLPPYDSQVYLGIFLKKLDGSEGDLIGDGGVHHLRTEGEWPEMCYRFKKEYWNNGYATEFATAFIRFWCSLPREPASLQVRPCSVGFQDTLEVAERVYASVKLDNKASLRVLKKAGFEPQDAIISSVENLGDFSLNYPDERSEWVKIIG